ncbi:hypothetical protein QBC46DRAFT_377811 [Diplogelasinospora grovesii]|uniref:Short-chain dehydrogenases/reductase n=1 Tax=Diplogelasinospora grovesii TaxID=303347 RepID=A0AAN6S7E6_9PEZI|nr:hypothetical protein QBC46DRAFT_377811 [Diplogelasinospora grovesii]
MVTLEQIQSSNGRIASELPSGLVAVFVGATAGIGETTLKQFAQYAAQPRIYFVGRSREAGSRITSELAEINPEGEYYFISADVSLLRSVDDICREIGKREHYINLLFLTTGTLITGKDTPEDLYYPMAVIYYSRIRFIVDLLPLLQRAPALRRVVTVYTATKEGPVDTNDFQARRLQMLAARGHGSSMMTLALESIALEAPDVSFIHAHPGHVKTNMGKEVRPGGAPPVQMTTIKAVLKVIGPFVNIPFEEAGERQVFFATSARFPARPTSSSSSSSSAASSTNTAGVPLPRDIKVARGTDGEVGSGVYSVNYDGETASAKVEALLARLRNENVVQKLWCHTEKEFVRVTGSAFIVYT